MVMSLFCFRGNHRLGRWGGGEMSSQERANGKGWQHRVIHGAIGGRRGRPARHLQLFPGSSLPSGHLPRGTCCWQGKDARRPGKPSWRRHRPRDVETRFASSGPKPVNAGHPHPTPECLNRGFFSLAANGGGGSVSPPATESSAFSTPFKPSLGSWCTQKRYLWKEAWF